MHYHVVAILPGNRTKSIVNKGEEYVLTEVVIPFVRGGVIKSKWGDKTQSYQVHELKVYGTEKPWDKKSGKKLEKFLAGKNNRANTFIKRAEKTLAIGDRRVFIVMPIQGEQFGTQNEQRIYKEYDKRFEAIRKVLSRFNVVAIREVSG